MSEQRLIDANALLRRLKEIHHMNGIKMRLEVEYAPTIDPVKHGEWVGLEFDGYADGFPVYDLFMCSKCGEELSGEDTPYINLYCRKCGAKMDGGIDGGGEK